MSPDLRTRAQRESSPPPYLARETPLERLGARLGYMLAVVGGSLLIDLVILLVIAAGAGG